MFELDLDSTENLYLFPPSLDPSKVEKLTGELRKLGLRSHAFILSSGSTSAGELKGYAIAKKALLANASAVNRHLGLGSQDSWHLSLPPWHIGGLSVLVRAFLAGAKVFRSEKKWEPNEWAKDLKGSKVTSIVPLQAYDLAKDRVKPPAGLKYVIVGGDHLSSELHRQFTDLGWPALRTFGMTEVCSQLATEKNVSSEPRMELLDIHETRVDKSARLSVKTPSLFSGVFKLGEDFEYQSSEDLVVDGYFVTSDLAIVEGNRLRHLGRVDQAFKSKGRLFHFNELREKVYNYAVDNQLYGKIELQLEEDNRTGKKAVLVLHKDLNRSKEKIFLDIKALTAPLALDEAKLVDDFRRTELGKLKR